MATRTPRTDGGKRRSLKGSSSTRSRPRKEATSAGASLERALAGGDFAGGLEQARAAWEVSRAPALAELVEVLSARLPRTVADWSRSMRELPVAEVPAYLDTLVSKVRFAEALRRVEALDELPPDPRVAAALTRLLLQPPFTAQSSRALWSSTLRQLTERHADPRTLAALEPVAPAYTKIFGSTTMGAHMQRLVQNLVEDLRQRFPATPEDAEARTLLEQLESSAPPTKAAAPPAASEADLLAAVYQNPDDDAPRLVLADWLLERGDPRGEFITVQYRRHRGETLTPAEEKREHALIAKHAKDWMGPLHGVLLKVHNVFRRGFIEEGCLVPRGPARVAASKCPAWATVRTLWVGLSETNDPGTDILMQSSLYNLRVLLKAPAALAAAMSSSREHNLETLGVELAAQEVSPTALFNIRRLASPSMFRPGGALFDPPGLPRLACLRLECPHEVPAHVLAELWRSPLAARLQRVIIPRYNVMEWTQSINDNAPPPPFHLEVELRSYNPSETVFLRRDAEGRYQPAPA